MFEREREGEREKKKKKKREKKRKKKREVNSNNFRGILPVVACHALETDFQLSRSPEQFYSFSALHSSSWYVMLVAGQCGDRSLTAETLRTQ